MILADERAGEVVVVASRVLCGSDDFNADVYSTIETEVPHVLVAPGARSDVVESNRPDGHLVRYTLYFPKTFDEPLEGCRVKVRGAWYSIVGAPDHHDKSRIRGAWSLVVEVVDVHG